MPCFCLPPQPQRPFPCFPLLQEGHKPLGSGWYLGERPHRGTEPGARAAAAVLTHRGLGLCLAISTGSSNSPTAASNTPGSPEPSCER